ncbi:MAG TPA: DUF4350 domain-containing protein [Cyclobacteriaceae bacterium]|nr:GldG family protein [Cyclobacteriaceae bacterium]HMV10062.1 DUF4350 domain-containing protein [Cyclobacteriaceae bacterium]HMV90922.1 DUF4350 domain-containing protein [Cyclobacteriaceae bacterium]HMW99833.1 DUF4350 domain-containing protein [Cyclobacteriaceae bacterium]HMX50225.1 DUF4350 domain-containing protein [Cyclobacteriaceae bacterium]
MRFCLLFLIVIMFACETQQKADNSFDVSVKNPAFTGINPIVLLDEAHNNMHTASGTYEPFVNLIANDGCSVRNNNDPFTADILAACNLLVIANAKGGKHDEKEKPAFTEEECDAVRQWVEAGGSLLLIADHYPFGSAAENLAQRFGVHMFNGETSDTIYFTGNAEFKDRLVFSRANGLLAINEITQGTSPADAVHTVIADRGQSLSIPDSSIVLLKLSPASRHSLPDSTWTDGDKTYTRFADAVSAYGNCQGVAMKIGKGKVIIMAEASMLTAQTFGDEKFGMNAGDNDNKQFTLNIVRWLLKK